MGFMDKLKGSGKKQEALYAEYAETHGLERSKDPIPAATKSLSGDAVTVERLDGQLRSGVRGTVAFVETTIRTSSTVLNDEFQQQVSGMPEGSSRVETSVKAHPSTVIMVPLESLGSALSGLAVKRNYDKQSFGKADTYGELRRMSLEGLELDDRFYVFVSEDADPERIRQILSPSFSAWLNDRDEKFFSFEFGQGTLVTKHPKFAKDPEQLDSYVDEAAEIAKRLEATPV